MNVPSVTYLMVNSTEEFTVTSKIVDYTTLNLRVIVTEIDHITNERESTVDVKYMTLSDRPSAAVFKLVEDGGQATAVHVGDVDEELKYADSEGVTIAVGDSVRWSTSSALEPTREGVVVAIGSIDDFYAYLRTRPQPDDYAKYDFTRGYGVFIRTKNAGKVSYYAPRPEILTVYPNRD